VTFCERYLNGIRDILYRPDLYYTFGFFWRFTLTTTQTDGGPVEFFCQKARDPLGRCPNRSIPYSFLVHFQLGSFAKGKKIQQQQQQQPNGNNWTKRRRWHEVKSKKALYTISENVYV
jgi:hypothetical protein